MWVKSIRSPQCHTDEIRSQNRLNLEQNSFKTTKTDSKRLCSAPPALLWPWKADHGPPGIRLSQWPPSLARSAAGQPHGFLATRNPGGRCVDLPLARSCANPHEALAPHHLYKARTEKGHRCLNLSRFFLLNLFTSTNLESKTQGQKNRFPHPKRSMHTHAF